MYYVYMIRCCDNSIYTGITTDINRRFNEHKNKTDKCAKYTKNHDVKKIEALWMCENKKIASILEYHIKKLTKDKKEYLIESNNIDDIFNGKIDSSKYTKNM